MTLPFGEKPCNLPLSLQAGKIQKYQELKGLKNFLASSPTPQNPTYWCFIAFLRLIGPIVELLSPKMSLLTRYVDFEHPDGNVLFLHPETRICRYKIFWNYHFSAFHVQYFWESSNVSIMAPSATFGALRTHKPTISPLLWAKSWINPLLPIWYSKTSSGWTSKSARTGSHASLFTLFHATPYICIFKAVATDKNALVGCWSKTLQSNSSRQANILQTTPT